MNNRATYKKEPAVIFEKITYAAMDTHKKQHTIAVLATATGEFVEMTIANTAKDITKMVKKIKTFSDAPVHFCYEAGVCGFGKYGTVTIYG